MKKIIQFLFTGKSSGEKVDFTLSTEQLTTQTCERPNISLYDWCRELNVSCASHRNPAYLG